MREMVDINVTLVWLLLAAGCSLMQAARAIKKKFPATPPLPLLPLGNFISQNDLTINNCQAEAPGKSGKENHRWCVVE